MPVLPNEVLWICFLLIDFTAALVIFRLFGRYGLYGLIVMNIIICNMQVMKIIHLFGVTTTLGNILYASIFFSTDVLGELYGKKEARKGVWLGFGMLVLATIYMQIALLFVPDKTDFIHPALEQIFTMYPRVVVGSLVAYLISQLHDVWAYDFWKVRARGRFLWFRNNASTMVSQAIDSVLFCTIAFWGLFPVAVFMQILLTTYVLKFAVAAADTPFIYIARKLKAPDLPREKEEAGMP